MLGDFVFICSQHYLVFICSQHYLETIKATISGHCAATERNGWCWWSVKHTVTNFYLASRAPSIDCKPFPFSNSNPTPIRVSNCDFFASNFHWNILCQFIFGTNCAVLVGVIFKNLLDVMVQGVSQFYDFSLSRNTFFVRSKKSRPNGAIYYAHCTTTL